MWIRSRDVALWAVRIALPLAVFMMTLTAIEEGVDFSDRPGMPAAPLPHQIYYGLGLFFFGGLDVGTPVGGPLWARDMMWVCYFIAPVVTASALIEGALRTFSPEYFRNRLSNHIVVVGQGPVARRLLARLRASAPRQSVVWVTKTPLATELTVRHRIGDIRDPSLRRGLRLDRARRILLLTDDDFVNLDATTAVHEEYPDLSVVAHVKDSHLLRATAGLSALEGTQIFNMHATAARHLVHTQLMTHFESTEPRDVVVLAGFGRFGQALLAELDRFLPGTFAHVILIDLNCERTARVYETEVGFPPDVRCTLLAHDLRDPEAWTQVDLLLEGQVQPVFVIASGDDAANIRAAIRLKDQHQDALVIARTFDPSPFGERTADASGFAIVSIGALLEDSMPESWWS